MTVYILIAGAIILFILGIMLIFKGVSLEEQTVVPISNPKEIAEFKSALTLSKEEKLPPEGMEIHKELPPETSVQQNTELGKSEVDQLKQDNERLTQKIDAQRDKYVQLEGDVGLIKKEYTQAKGYASEKVKGLEDELAKLRQKKEQALSNSESVEELKSKNELLEKKYSESQNQQTEMKVSVDQLKAQNDDSLTQIKALEERIEQLQTGLTSTQKTGKEQLAAAHETISVLKDQQPEASRSELETLGGKLSESIAVLEVLKRENKNLQQLNSDLKEHFKRTEELNAHLLEKERAMQYELTKNRAQSLGLEKICEDFKVQIETMATSAATE